ncbi:MAG: ABC transporter permease subunit [Proteobacteria bacterium]|nr:ABC transporter permease subunit [Pseudomonadota bacterium]
MGGRAGLVAQILLLGAVVLLLAWLARNAAANIAARGLASGYDFLGRSAGFDISQHLIAYAPEDTYWRVFLVGAVNTLLVSVLGIVSATALGVLVGVMRVSRNWIARTVATVYVEVVRNIPLPIQILVWYSLMLIAPPPRAALKLGDHIALSNRGLYLPWPQPSTQWLYTLAWIAVSVAAGAVLERWLDRQSRISGVARSFWPGWMLTIIGTAFALTVADNPESWSFPRFHGFDFEGGLVLAPALVALWAALTFYTAGFIGEVVRGGIVAVAPGQGEAARSLGLSDGQALRLVILPQAFRVIVPPLASQYLNLVKNSSLAVIIGYPDLVATFGGTVLNQTGQAIECLSLVMAFYLAVSLTISVLMNAWNARTAAWSAR